MTDISPIEKQQAPSTPPIVKYKIQPIAIIIPANIENIKINPFYYFYIYDNIFFQKMQPYLHLKIFFDFL